MALPSPPAPPAVPRVRHDPGETRGAPLAAEPPAVKQPGRSEEPHSSGDTPRPLTLLAAMLLAAAAGWLAWGPSTGVVQRVWHVWARHIDRIQPRRADLPYVTTRPMVPGSLFDASPASSPRGSQQGDEVVLGTPLPHAAPAATAERGVADRR